MVYTRRVYTPPLDTDGNPLYPVTKAEAKQHLRVTWDDDDADITMKLGAAVEDIEGVMNRQLLPAIWDVFLDGFPSDSDEIQLPLGQLQSITSLTYTDVDGVPAVWTQTTGTDLQDSSSVVRAHIDTAREPALIRLVYSGIWPTTILKTVNAIQIRMTCGYADASSVPAQIKEAILLQLGHYYNNREAVVLGKSVAIDSKPLALGVHSLIARRRLPSFG